MTSLNKVGPVLISSSQVSNAIIEAIKQNYPDVQVIHRGGYIRVLSSKECRILRKEIEEKLGRPLVFPHDIELVMPSFQGQLEITEDWVKWTNWT